MKRKGRDIKERSEDEEIVNSMREGVKDEGKGRNNDVGKRGRNKQEINEVKLEKKMTRIRRK